MTFKGEHLEVKYCKFCDSSHAGTCEKDPAHKHVPLADTDARNEPKGYNTDKSPWERHRYE